MADAARLEVDQGDPVGGEDKPVHDAEGAGVGDVLFDEDLPGSEEDLSHLLFVQEPLDHGLLFCGEAVRGNRLAIACEAGEDRVDAKTALNSRLDGGGAQGRVHFVAVGWHGGEIAQIVWLAQVEEGMFGGLNLVLAAAGGLVAAAGGSLAVAEAAGIEGAGDPPTAAPPAGDMR